ncbi:MAG TPA: xanthine dehydrogenase family protein molybdopterin-binding subunit [Pseudolabrys sp.]|uniref:xanthine dehydrogenase family protein molybdopterin-binding subunit n=1 Tax=Pseudolabrys sp. TaxID=1960880 RepID=UPI002DDCED9B|nr:xanthine dehydrogenase family protein molybdopterin-binding subunit [Pseudolabrys sp.]HEV2627028.1 xanthine dehydrogenase family protein molybdopterin-binding subunit [Pseudolabrys sp.]
MHAPATSTRIGQPVPRKEDLRLITGRGRYTDDLNVDGQAYAVMVRSPHAHANILGIDTRAASAVPGVIAVLTGADFIADQMKPIPNKTFSLHPAEMPLVNSDGTPAFNMPDYPLPADKARFVGEAIVMVIAESIDAAKDGADRVQIDYEPLPSVTFTVEAAAAGAPRVRDENSSNVCIDAQVGDAAATEAAFRKAAQVVKVKTWIPRVAGSPMEPRAAIGEYDPQTGHYTIYTCSGSTLRLRRDLSLVLDVPETHVRLVIRDVGGNFGTRGAIFAEQPLVAWAARRIGRRVKWTSERSELLLSDYQGRDLAVEAELALAADGTFLAMRGSNVGNLGSHTGNFSMVQKGVEIMSSIYRMPAAHFRARAVLSHTAPTRPYRSSGRPEVIYVMERLIDLAARQAGFDRVELRLRNLVAQSELPYRNPFGLVYDSGDYIGVMKRTLVLSDWDGFPARKAEARKRGKYRGIGVANYVDTATGIPREKARITVHPDGSAELVIGTVSNGQGHETSFAQLLNEWLGVPFDKVRLVTGDTDIVDVGGGTHSGRGMRLGSIVIWRASNKVIDKAKQVVGLLLQKSPADVVFADGTFTVAGEAVMRLAEVAEAMATRADLPQDLRGPLGAECDETVNEAGFPYGCHVCEVEIDADLGLVEIIRHTTIDDVGKAVNPLIIHGQTHGGIAQGVGQALLEHCFYDATSGQMLAGSFMDYAMPRADILPSFTTDISEVPSTTHPLGIRPAGEGGTTPALGVVINAIVDALSEFGVTHMEMPATPERIWRAIHGKPQRSRIVPDAVEQDISLS